MKNIMVGVLILLSAFAFSAEAGVKNPVKSLSSAKEKETYLPILNRWGGYYPISQLERFDEWHATARGGCFFEEPVFASFWRVFKEGKKVPSVDFDKDMVVFVGGEGSSQPLFITKISIKEGVAEVATDVRSSESTHEEGLPMALAVIPRAAVKSIRIGQQQITVEPSAEEHDDLVPAGSGKHRVQR
jgi:hypothetical protein